MTFALLRWLLPSIGLRIRRHPVLPSIVIVSSDEKALWLYDTATGSHS